MLFRFGSNAFWGENSTGTWTVTITDAAGGNVGTVRSLNLAAYGDSLTVDDLYVFTNEYASVGSDPARATLADSDGGIDTLNAAAVTSASTLDLRAGATSIIAGKALKIANGTVIENAWGGDGADMILGNSSANRLYGARGNDSLEGGAGDDLLDGGAGNDTARFTGDRSRYTIVSESGGYRVTDSQAGGDGSDLLVNVETIRFADGLYSLTGDTTPPPPPPPPPPPSTDINGTAGDDVLEGSSADEQLFGRDGGDRLRGKSGADRLDGGNGVDVADYGTSAAGVLVNLATGATVGGDAAGDVLVAIENIDGSALADTLVGNAASNRLSGGSGNDSLDGGAGADSLLGGAGDDCFYVDHGGDVVSEVANEGSDTIVSTLSWTLGANVENLTLAGSSTINGTGNALANTIVGNGAANLLDGGSGDDLLQGGLGNDTLYGQAGNDRLEGGDGADLLVGGAGRDDLTGGAGGDRFDFDLAAHTVVGSADWILDFGTGDRIDLSTMDARANTKKNDAFQFVGEAQFTGAAGQLRYEVVDLTGTADDYTRILGDLNGDRVADFEIILVGDTSALHSTDFIL